MAFFYILSFSLILAVSSAAPNFEYAVSAAPKQLHQFIHIPQSDVVNLLSKLSSHRKLAQVKSTIVNADSPKRTTDSHAETDLAAYEKESIPNKESSRSSSLPVSARQNKLSFERCTSSTECAGDRTCREPPGLPGRCIPPDGLKRCTSSLECTTLGEVCASASDDLSICVSRKEATPVPSPSPPGAPQPGAPQPGAPQPGAAAAQGSDPCIAVESLKHLSRQELVFQKDRLANVLCDENDSCATPGHMVLYHGTGMMMKSYCEIVGGCVKKVMYVNSPRYSKAITVTSKSENMVFTAFSARYVTHTEEGFLSMAIRLGF